jgi:hypothetical protein
MEPRHGIESELSKCLGIQTDYPTSFSKNSHIHSIHEWQILATYIRMIFVV